MIGLAQASWVKLRGLPFSRAVPNFSRILCVVFVELLAIFPAFLAQLPLREKQQLIGGSARTERRQEKSCKLLLPCSLITTDPLFQHLWYSGLLGEWRKASSMSMGVFPLLGPRFFAALLTTLRRCCRMDLQSAREQCRSVQPNNLRACMISTSRKWTPYQFLAIPHSSRVLLHPMQFPH